MPVSQTPYGRDVAVAAHNCYVSRLQNYSSVCDITPGNSSVENSQLTIACLHASLDASADLVELDLIYVDGTLRIAHGHHKHEVDDATLRSVLADDKLRSAKAGLFLEIKEASSSLSEIDTFLKALFDLLLEFPEYARSDRKLFLRSFFGNIQYLRSAYTLLDSDVRYHQLQNHIRLHALLDGRFSTLRERQSQISECVTYQINGIEVDYKSSNLLPQLNYAQDLGLATGIWTIPKSVGEVFVATLRDNVDIITCDFGVSKCRDIIREKNGLIYAPIWKTPDNDSHLRYYKRSSEEILSVDLVAPGRPAIQKGVLGSEMFGTYLSFDTSKSECLPLVDVDNGVSDGFLVSALVRFNRDAVTTLKDTMGIVNKSDSAGFALELYRDAADPVVRFGVHIGGDYRYAQVKTSRLDLNKSHLITGAYDGNGSVWLFINNQTREKVGPFSEGVALNDSPIVIGADPQGTSSSRYFFSGDVQHVVILNWTNH